MTYTTLSLKIVALILGGLWLFLPGLLAVLQPVRVQGLLRKLPRHFEAGVITCVISALWFCWLVWHVDMAEYTDNRVHITLFGLALCGLTVWQLPTFLFARGYGALLLLGTEVLLSAAMPVPTATRFFVTLLAYIWAVSGMFFVAMPHLIRDLFHAVAQTPERVRLAGGIRAVLGVILIVLALLFYP